ncbi:phage portal protein [Phocaeicola barnesiae]|uniref:Phage portal protein n=1 Tax=Phocaeicola barnesiae TaxID=376804 RepID=A0AAW5N9G0_9BACT|nr:phage portal protein [Phocaeicola barnesiae]MCR8874883.1 phage portal protein [Phocaeicola barnesiae]
MNIFNIFRRKDNKRNTEERSYYTDALTFNAYSSYNSSYAMRLSAVYRAVQLISDSIAMLPVSISVLQNGYKTVDTTNKLNYILNCCPNALMTRYTFVKNLITDVLLQGNGFAYIKRDEKGNCIGLDYIKATDVTIHYNELSKELFYTATGYRNKIEPCNIIHLLRYSNNAVEGISVIKNAISTLQLSTDIDNQAANFFKSGCSLNGILKVNSTLTEQQRQQIKSSWNTTYNGNGGGLAVIQGNMDYQQISVNAADAQLLESRNYQISDIARFFGISPILLGDLSKSSYSTLEQTQLQFLSQTLQPYITMLELEFTRKIFRPSQSGKFFVDWDEKALLRTDKTTVANYYVTLLQNGLLTANEIRKELGYPEIEGGDTTVMQAQYLSQQAINNEQIEKNIIQDEKTE